MDGGDVPRQALELELPVAVASVEQARLAVHRWLGDEALSAHVLTTLELVIEEVVMNLVLHAFDDARGQHFRLMVQALGDELRLDFEDEGRDFDPTATPSVRAAVSREEVRPGGLGLRLLHKRARWMRHSRCDGRNRLSIAIALGSA